MLEKLLAVNVEQRRERLRLTQGELAELSRVSVRTIREVEAGRSNIGIKPLSRLLEVLGLEVVVKVSS